MSVVVPALNEAENLPRLLPRIDAVLSALRYEVIVVDDGSADGTHAACAVLAQRYPVRLHVRPAPAGGLSGAVLEGFALARGATLVVMDADLQHPPERIPALLAALDSPGIELVLGSRYTPGGSTADRWGLLRRINSRVATLLARPFAAGTRDPMSGFFALRRETLDRAGRLTPQGYKIALEVLCKCRVRRVGEVPIDFGERAGGASKLGVAQQVKYIEHLSRLYDFCFPRGSPLVKFALAAGLAWFIGFALFVALLFAGFKPMPAASLSYPAALVVSAILHARCVRTRRLVFPTLPPPHPWRDFVAVALAEWAACALAAIWIAARVREIHVAEVFGLTYAAATLTRYVLRKEVIQDIRGLRHAPEGDVAPQDTAPPNVASRRAA